MARRRVWLGFGLLAAALGSLQSGPAAGAEGDAFNGRLLFAQCRLCHSLKAGETKVGPSLHGLFGRRAGAVDGFDYSPGMKDAGIVWDEASLDAFLKRPKAVIPGTKMVYGGLGRAEDRADLIAYMKQALKK